MLQGKLQRDWASIMSRVRHSKNVGITKVGIFKNYDKYANNISGNRDNV